MFLAVRASIHAALASAIDGPPHHLPFNLLQFPHVHDEMLH